MTATPAAALCGNHSQRLAVGICVRCGTAICDECVTRIDGINHCSGCWAQLTTAAAASEPSFEPASWGGALASGWVALLTLLAWALIELAMPG